MTALSSPDPDQDIAVESMILIPVLFDRWRDPVIIIRRPQFMGIPVLQNGADADDEDCRMHLRNLFVSRCLRVKSG